MTDRTRRVPNAAELFWAKVNRDGPVSVARPELGPCWAWTAATRNGYGAFNVPATANQRRRRIDAHRWAYETCVATLPDGHELEHLCHTVDALTVGCGGGPTCPHRPCVNPRHLAPVPRNAEVRGIAARHAARTTCPEGHPYDRVDGRGRRRCSRCVRAQAVARYRAARSLPTLADEHAALTAWLDEITADTD